MPNHRIVVIDNDSDFFRPLHMHLSSCEIDYQRFSDIETYLCEHDYAFHFLLARAADLDRALQDQERRFNRKFYNCTYMLAFDDVVYVDLIKKVLKEGADDYILSPFNTELVYLKIRAQQNRLNFLEKLYLSDQSAIIYKNLTIDPFSKQIFLKNQRINLTGSEFNILYTLAKSPHDVFDMDYLFQLITGQKSLGDYNALMTHISRLRKKLAKIDASHHYILTVRNKGYKFNAHIAEYMR